MYVVSFACLPEWFSYIFLPSHHLSIPLYEYAALSIHPLSPTMSNYSAPVEVVQPTLRQSPFFMAPFILQVGPYLSAFSSPSQTLSSQCSDLLGLDGSR